MVVLKAVGRIARIVILTAAALAAILAIGGHILDMGAEPTFEMVEVEPGRRLHVACAGPNEGPFVLYDAGAFGIHVDGWWVREALKDQFRVCLYDRAGMGWSDPVPDGQAPAPDWHVADMRRLVAALGVDEPFYLVGHSMAGVRLHAFANLHRDELAGLVFVDAAITQAFVTERGRRQIGLYKRAMQVGAFSARLGIARAVSSLVPDELDLPEAQLKDKRRAISWLRHHKASAAEVGAAGLGVAYLQDVRAETIPMAVFSTRAGGGPNAAVAARAREVAGYGYAEGLPEETHVSLLNRAGADRIAKAIREMEALRAAAVEPTGVAP